MAREVVGLLVASPDDRICDATVGSGGHAAVILEALGPRGFLIGLDRDARALERTRANLAGHGERFVLQASNFRDMRQAVLPFAPEGVDGVLLDLGVSSEQLDDPGAGFSFQSAGPLSMSMEPGRRPDARDLLNTADEEELARILKENGDVRGARRVARAIVRARPLDTTADLSGAASKGGAGRPEDLARVFQAVRIAVNDEFGALKAALEGLYDMVRPGGRVVVLSYHSGEDRIVKRFFSPVTMGKPMPWPAADTPAPWRLLTRGAVTPSQEELAENSRSRSARLRAARREGG